MDPELTTSTPGWSFPSTLGRILLDPDPAPMVGGMAPPAWVR